jgi:hypothetical protein
MIKLLDLLKEDNPFVPRGSKEEREKDYNRITQNKIQEYIKNGMEGDLDLAFTSITSLPSNLTKVGGYLDLRYTPLSKKYSEDEIRAMVPNIEGEIYI